MIFLMLHIEQRYVLLDKLSAKSSSFPCEILMLVSSPDDKAENDIIFSKQKQKLMYYLTVSV